MSGVIDSKELFRTLKDYDRFDTARVVAHGSGIEWDNGLDYSADSLEVMAEQQRGMSGQDFADWMKEMGISLQEAADLFGVVPSTIKAYRKSQRLPVAIQIACRALKNDPDLFLARYHPRVAGRPRKEAVG
jgi:hypothetical protein